MKTPTVRTDRSIVPDAVRHASADFAVTPGAYKFRARGHLGEALRAAFPKMASRVDGRDTILTAALPDQTAVYGVLGTIEELGLELIALRRMPPG